MFDRASSEEMLARNEHSESKSSSESSGSTPRPMATDARGAAVSREALVTEEIKPQVLKTARILIVGPSGSGKTSIIKTSCYSTKNSLDNIPYIATKRTEVTKLRMKDQPFELIDTPGFDGINMSDADAFGEISNYLLNTRQAQVGITGIIYVHRAGNAVHSMSLLRNFRVLTNIFLGNAGMARLTFLVTQTDNQDADYAEILNSRGSVFQAAFSAGARFAACPNQTGFIQLLEHYASQEPIILPIQLDQSYKFHHNFLNRVEKELGYYEYSSGQSLLNEQERQLRELYESQLSVQRESELQVHQQLKQSQLEYSSLRSQLQLQENIEQSQVVQALKDINRMIDDFGRSMAAYLTDNYPVMRTYEKEAIAGKWRSETFKSIHQFSSHEAVEAKIDKHVNTFLAQRLRPLIKGVFGRDISLREIDAEKLWPLIKTAWDWNSDLKGGVIMLGDFVQTSSSRSQFDTGSMEEFEAISSDHIPTNALGTIALGLVCEKAVGGGNPVDKVVVCKTVVATESIFG
ncbi:hypothetical protein RhiTH_011495 [Rhizoctonia solani]